MEFYKILLITLVPLTLGLVISRLVPHRGSKESKEIKVLRFPMFYRVVPILLFCFCVLISIYVLIFQFEDWLYLLILFGFFGGPSLVMFTAWSLWKVEINDNGFIYRNFFGKKAEYKFKDLEYKQHSKGLKWYFYKDKKKIFCMPFYIENGDILDKLYHKRVNR